MFFSILFFLFIFIIIFGYFIYPKVTFYIKKNPPQKSEHIPNVTILIPTYNEEQTIARKIQNTLTANYPKEKIEVVVIDNGSTDKTVSVAKQFPIILLQSAEGKIKALNKGLDYAKTDIIIMTDADVEIAKDSILNLVIYLHNNIGAVNGYVVTIFDKSNSLMKEKEQYKKEDWKLRYKESLIDSTCSLDGKLIAFRKSIFPKFAKNYLTDDYSMTFAIRSKGYRLLVSRSAEVYEVCANNYISEIKQFKRYAIDAIITSFKNIKFLFNPKYGYFGMMTFPFRRFFPPLYPIFLGYIVIYLFIYYPWHTLILIIAGFLYLGYYRKLILAQIFAIILSYFNLYKIGNLRGGKWKTVRK